MKKRKFDEFIEGTEIFNGINKFLDKIQQELLQFIKNNTDEEKGVY